MFCFYEKYTVIAAKTKTLDFSNSFDYNVGKTAMENLLDSNINKMSIVKQSLILYKIFVHWFPFSRKHKIMFLESTINILGQVLDSSIEEERWQELFDLYEEENNKTYIRYKYITNKIVTCSDNKEMRMRYFNHILKHYTCFKEILEFDANQLVNEILNEKWQKIQEKNTKKCNCCKK